MIVRIALRAAAAVCASMLAVGAAGASEAAVGDPPQARVVGYENYNFSTTGEYKVSVDCSTSLSIPMCDTLTIERSDDNGATWNPQATLSNIDDTNFTAVLAGPGLTTMWRAQSTKDGVTGPYSEPYVITAPLAPGKPKITRITIPPVRTGAWLCWQDAPENIGQARVFGYLLTLRAGGRTYRVQPRYTATVGPDLCGEVIPLGGIGLKQALSGKRLTASVAPLTNVTRDGEVVTVKRVRADEGAHVIFPRPAH